MRKSKIIPISFFVLLIVLFSAFTANNDKKTVDDANSSTEESQAIEYIKEDNILAVNYFDVGQGDCEFIELPNDMCMLIDSGEYGNGDEIISKINYLGYDRIDYVVATHPHSDHIGTMSEIIKEFEIGDIYMPRATSTSSTYQYLLETISNEGLKIHTAKAGKNIYKDDSLSIDILSPSGDDYKDLNNYSVVVKITYDSSSFLFTGDAESLVEKEMISNSYSMLQSDVLKVGHHGSKYSSSNDFIDAVSPEYAVISCGSGNTYGHPHEQALNRIAKSTTDIFRTDKYSDIRFETNGDGTYKYTLNFFDELTVVE